MHIAIIGGVHRIVGGLKTVARTQFHVHPIATISDSRRQIYVERAAGVEFAIVVAFGHGVACHQVVVKLPHLGGAEGETHHVHCHRIPHAIHVVVGGGATAGGGVVGDF